MYQGMAVEPVSVAVLATKIGSTILSKFIGSPRGEYQKFGREIAPILSTQIQNTGEPAMAFWFGEGVGIDTDGELIVIPGLASVEAYQAAVQEFANRRGTGVQSYEFGQFIRYAPTGFVGPPAPGGPMPKVDDDAMQAGFFGSGELTTMSAIALVGMAYLALRGFK